MFVSFGNHLHLLPSQLCCSSPHLSPGCLQTLLASKTASYESIQTSEDAKQKIRKMFNKVELSVSAFDTAWVAMAPSPASPDTPCFRGTLDWILENQLPNGSWGLPDQDPTLIKDTLLSTLACILALKRWSVGEEQMTKGLDFIVSKFNSAMDKQLHSPIGFDVIFPSMIQEAIKMGVNLDLKLTDVDYVLYRKQLELRRINSKHPKSRNFYLAYISEGMGKSQDWGMAMTYQRKNGSLFNSPSTTAAAFSHLLDSRCHSYLCSVLEQFGNAVPTIYPFDAYSRLYMVDTLERLGIDRFFKENIRSVLDETFRKWEDGDDEIFSDSVTCTMALRLLRGHGYDVSSEQLAICHEQDCSFDHFGGHLEDIRAALELFKAAEFVIHPHESYLENCFSRAKHFLDKKIFNQTMQADKFTEHITQEIADTLKNPYHACLERLSIRKCVEHYISDDTRVFKSSIRNTNFCNEVLFCLATADFSYCQSVHMQELKELQRWVTESKLDQLTFSRQKLGYCYFSAAATLSSPEVADARISWAKNGVLTTVVDDFFDVGSSKEEQLNLIELVKKWDANTSVQSCSEKVHIIYSAIRASVCEIGEKAYPLQGRDVTGHIIETWLSLINSMMKEAEMIRNKSMLTLGDYMKNGCVSFALGPIVLPALYLIGPKLSDQVIKSTEYQNLFENMSTCGRLLNDIQGFQRESKEGKLNALSLHLLHGGGTINKEDAARDLQWIIEDKRRKLLRAVLRGDDSVIPRECRDLFWKMSRVLHFFYMKDDGFTSKDMESVVKAVLYDPII